MTRNNTFFTLSLLLILGITAIPAKAQQGEIVRGNYVYRILDAQRACVNLFSGQTIGANTIIEAWHSPIQGNHNRCKYQYRRNYQINAGINVGGLGAGISGNDNTDIREATENIPRSRACNQQQGTVWAVMSRSGYIYCRHNR